MKDTHDPRCEVAQLIFTYLNAYGEEMNFRDGPLEVAYLLENEEEWLPDDKEDAEQREALEALMRHIESIITHATKEHLANSTPEQLEELISKLLTDCVLGQSQEQVDYRGRA